MDTLSEKDIPTELGQKIPEFRAEHKHVYAIEIFDCVYAFRPLTWREYRRLSEEAKSNPLVPEKICDVALLWPSAVPELAPAGVVDTIAGHILEISGFDNPEALKSTIEWARERVEDDVEATIISVICKAFPAYTPEDLYELKFLDLMMRFAMAEKIIGVSHEAEQQQPEPQRGEAYGQPMPMRAPDINPNAGPPDFDKDNKDFREF